MNHSLNFISGHGGRLSSKADKAQNRGYRSLLVDGLEGGRSSLSDDINHGNLANSISKYGHFGLNSEGNPGGGAATELSGEHAIFSGSAEVDKKAFDGPTVKRSSSNEEAKRGGVEIKSQGISQPQFGGAQLGLSNIHTQSSPSQPGYPYYGYLPGQSLFGQGSTGQYQIGHPLSYPGYGTVPGQGGHFGSWFPQGRNPGLYHGYTGLGVAVGSGQDGQLSAPYGQGLAQQFGQPGGYYSPGTNGQLGTSLQGLYTGGQPINYGTTSGNIPSQGPQGGLLPWSPLGTPGTFGQTGTLNPTQNQCPAGFVALPGAGRCIPYCINGETIGCVPPGPYPSNGLIPGPYGGVEKALGSNLYTAGDSANLLSAASGPMRTLSRYIAPGFYYPPPQHLNANPNVWDPAARYYFTLESQEVAKDAFRPLSPFPNPISPTTSFPIPYSQI